MKTAAVIANVTKDKGLARTKEVVNILNDLGVHVKMPDRFSAYVDNAEFSSGDGCYNGAEMAIVLGGDGTILEVAQKCADYNIPVLGLNLGYLGFLSEIEIGERDALTDIINGKYRIEERMMLETHVEGSAATHTALNDVVISRGDSSRMLNLNVYADDLLISSYMADGLIFSTPTGSTAYSLSAGGPIICPNMQLMAISPICPHSLHSRSIIVPSHMTIKIVINPSHSKSAVVATDGKSMSRLGPDDEVIVKKSEKTAKLVRTPDSNFFDSLRMKLEGN